MNFKGIVELINGEIELIQSENNLLKLHIQELELIIKGKDAIIESMAQGKSCYGCAYHPLNSNTPYEWHCDNCIRDNTDTRVDNYKLYIEPKENQDVK